MDTNRRNSPIFNQNPVNTPVNIATNNIFQNSNFTATVNPQQPTLSHQSNHLPPSTLSFVIKNHPSTSISPQSSTLPPQNQFQPNQIHHPINQSQIYNNIAPNPNNLHIQHGNHNQHHVNTQQHQSALNLVNLNHNGNSQNVLFYQSGVDITNNNPQHLHNQQQNNTQHVLNPTSQISGNIQLLNQNLTLPSFFSSKLPNPILPQTHTLPPSNHANPLQNKFPLHNQQPSLLQLNSLLKTPQPPSVLSQNNAQQGMIFNTQPQYNVNNTNAFPLLHKSNSNSHNNNYNNNNNNGVSFFSNLGIQTPAFPQIISKRTHSQSNSPQSLHILHNQPQINQINQINHINHINQPNQLYQIQNQIPPNIVNSLHQLQDVKDDSYHFFDRNNDLNSNTKRQKSSPTIPAQLSQLSYPQQQQQHQQLHQRQHLRSVSDGSSININIGLNNNNDGINQVETRSLRASVNSTHANALNNGTNNNNNHHNNTHNTHNIHNTHNTHNNDQIETHSHSDDHILGQILPDPESNRLYFEWMIARGSASKYTSTNVNVKPIIPIKRIKDPNILSSLDPTRPSHHTLYCYTCHTCCDNQERHLMMHEQYFECQALGSNLNNDQSKVKLCHICMVGSKSGNIINHLNGYQHKILADRRAGGIPNPIPCCVWSSAVDTQPNNNILHDYSIVQLAKTVNGNGNNGGDNLLGLNLPQNNQQQNNQQQNNQIICNNNTNFHDQQLSFINNSNNNNNNNNNSNINTHFNLFDHHDHHHHNNQQFNSLLPQHHQHQHQQHGQCGNQYNQLPPNQLNFHQQQQLQFIQLPQTRPCSSNPQSECNTTDDEHHQQNQIGGINPNNNNNNNTPSVTTSNHPIVQSIVPIQFINDQKILNYIDENRGNLDKYKLWCNTCSLLCDKPAHHISMHELFFNHMIQPYDQNIKICRVCLVGTKSTSLNSHLKSYQHRILSLRAASIDDPFSENRAKLLNRATEFQKVEQLRIASLLPPPSQPQISPQNDTFSTLSALDIQQFQQSWAKSAPLAFNSLDVATQTDKQKFSHINVSTQTHLPAQSHSILIYSKHPKVEPIALVDSLHPSSPEYQLIPKEMAGTKQLYKYFCLSCLTYVPEAKHHRSMHESYWSLVETYIIQQERLLKYDRSTLGPLEKGNNNPFNIDITKFGGNDRVRICHPCLLGVKRSGFAAHIVCPAHMKRLQAFSVANEDKNGNDGDGNGDGNGDGIKIDVVGDCGEKNNNSNNDSTNDDEKNDKKDPILTPLADLSTSSSPSSPLSSPLSSPTILVENNNSPISTPTTSTTIILTPIMTTLETIPLRVQPLLSLPIQSSSPSSNPTIPSPPIAVPRTLNRIEQDPSSPLGHDEDIHNNHVDSISQVFEHKNGNEKDHQNLITIKNLPQYTLKSPSSPDITQIPHHFGETRGK